MASQKISRASTENFLKMAGFWFDNTFEYRNVSKWCKLTERQGRIILDDLIKRGRVKVDSEGATRLTAVTSAH